MREADTPAGPTSPPPADAAPADEPGSTRGIAEKIYDQIENGLGQGTIAMIAFLVALPVVVVAAHCVML